MKSRTSQSDLTCCNVTISEQPPAMLKYQLKLRATFGHVFFCELHTQTHIHISGVQETSLYLYVCKGMSIIIRY